MPPVAVVSRYPARGWMMTWFFVVSAAIPSEKTSLAIRFSASGVSPAIRPMRSRRLTITSPTRNPEAS